MARYRGTVLSTRSAEDTFDYMADFANAAVWDPGTASAERLDPGTVGLGSTFRLGVRVGIRGRRRSTTASWRSIVRTEWSCWASRTPSGPRTR